MCGKRKHQFVSPSTVRSVHKILRSAFEQAVKWELMEKNPCIYATLPKYTSKKRDIWTAETLFHALKVRDDPKLRLCINLSFSCSLRLGELLGLTWDCVDITTETPESIDAGRASMLCFPCTFFSHFFKCSAHRCHSLRIFFEITHPLCQNRIKASFTG